MRLLRGIPTLETTGVVLLSLFLVAMFVEPLRSSGIVGPFAVIVVVGGIGYLAGRIWSRLRHSRPPDVVDSRNVVTGVIHLTDAGPWSIPVGTVAVLQLPVGRRDVAIIDYGEGSMVAMRPPPGVAWPGVYPGQVLRIEGAGYEGTVLVERIEAYREPHY